MPNRIILRNNSTPGAVPSAATLQPGELAINTATGGLYTLLADNTTVHTVVPPGGAAVGRVSSPTWSASMTLNWATADIFRVTLGGATTNFTFSGATDGQKLILELTQDATGNRSVVWPASVRFSATLSGITLSTTAGKLDRLGFIYHAPSAKYDLVALSLGY